ncbi:MAG: DUF3857 domain-containing protein [Bacteroidales bacterium]|nr:DUF3857 domain-containing protein [Bacteroidales bacterium]
MKNYLFAILFVFNTCLLFASNDLELNANAIIEEYNTDFYVESPKNAKLKVNIKIKVLNENGDIFSEFSEYYDQYKRILFFDGKIFDSNNKKIRRISITDLNDNSLINNFSTYEDNRIKTYSPNIKNYPYTIEYTYIITYSGIINYPNWIPLSDYYLAVKNSVINVHVPKSMNIKYKNYNIEDPKIQAENNKDILTWEVSNLSALDSENHHIGFYNFTPSVMLAPTEFRIENYSGNMKSWNSFGNWVNNLLEGQDNLPDEAIKEIQYLVSDDSSKIDIIKKIYKYVQNHTRYVSIQLGIGGWQPFNAETVYNLGYGDCKALTNYTKSLLKSCGIESYYTLIKAGKNANDIDSNFPSNQFNHAILCVPVEKDTIWLECTSQTSPFGYLSSFTDNRNALLIKENASKLVKTTNYTIENNTQNRVAHIILNSLGDASGNIFTSYSGILYENISYMIGLGDKKQEELLYKKIDLNNINLNSFDLGVQKNIIPKAFEKLNLDINNLATISSSRMFIPLNLMNKNTYIPKDQNSRISPVKINIEFYDIDSVYYTYPKQFTIEYLPEDIQLTSSFGEYIVKIESIENKILYIRELKIFKGIYPASEYNNFYSFLSNISKSDKIKCVLKQEQH